MKAEQQSEQEDLGRATSEHLDQTATRGTQSPGPWFGPVHYGNKLFEIQDAKRRVALVDSQHDANYIIKACNAYPKLVYELKRLCVSIPAQLGSNARFDNALLRELGELE